MAKQIISTKNAPGAVGPYSQATLADGLLFVSGQLPMNPEAGELIIGDVQAATKLCLTNLKAVVEAAGGTLADVLKTTVFLKDMGDFAPMNEVYATFFTENPPARACVQAAALPKDVDVEIEAVAKIA